MNVERDNKCGREKAPFRGKRIPFIMQKDYIYYAKGLLLQCKKGSFSLQKLYFGSDKKPFWKMNGVSDAAKTIKTDLQNLYN